MVTLRIIAHGSHLPPITIIREIFFLISSESLFIISYMDTFQLKVSISSIFRSEFEQLMEINELQHTSQLVNVLTNATRQLNDKFNVSEFARPKVLQSNGRRWTVADTYHRLHLKHQLLLNTQVERILFDAKDNAHSATLRAIGVSYRQNGRIYDAFASKGVILSAGTIGSPVILQKSGIGPRHLYENGELNRTAHDASIVSIKLQMDLPAVGANLQDHVTTGMDLIVLNQTLGLEPWHTYSPQQFFDYFVNGNGPLTTIGCEALGFMRTHLQPNDGNSSAPDLGFMVLPMGTTVDAGVYLRRVTNINERSWQQYFKPLISQTTVSILPIVLHPQSRGTITIRSSRNNDQIETIINPNYLQHPDDIDVLVAGLKFIAELVETPSFQTLGAKLNPKPFPGCEHLAFASDEYWQCYAQHLTLTAYHPVGTCRLGRAANDSVVDNDTFQVHNADGLYVCDASVMPTMPSANPQAAVGMLARKFLQSFGRKKWINWSAESIVVSLVRIIYLAFHSKFRKKTPQCMQNPQMEIKL